MKIFEKFPDWAVIGFGIAMLMLFLFLASDIMSQGQNGGSSLGYFFGLGVVIALVCRK